MVDSKERYGFLSLPLDKSEYMVKCDDCYAVIRKTAAFKESVEGDVCESCKAKRQLGSESFWA
jgi:NMD protein affecting ribosome stability and mRNA decay